MSIAENGTDVVVDRPGDHWRVPTVAQEYESGRFHNLKGRVYRRLEESILDQALSGLQAGSTVLDAACGTGRVTALLRRHGFRPTGHDISDAMVAVARRQLASLGYDEVPFSTGDVRHLPYPTGSFEAATCVGLLMHLDADARVAVLRQLARVARERIVVQYVCLDVFSRVRARMTGQPPGNVRYPVSAAELRADLERSGLREHARFWALRGLSTSLVLRLGRADSVRNSP